MWSPRYAICNELFEGWDFERICRTVANLGYSGLELAPFTLAPRITEVSAAQRQQLRQQAAAQGLRIIGLHWLLARTEGLQLTSPKPVVRQRTADYLVELARCCRDLGGDLLVLGSPAQRRIPPGASYAQAEDYALDTLSRARAGLVEAGVRLCLEPLAPPEADFLTSCAEAARLLDRLGDSVFALHLDVKAMSAESQPIPELIHRYARRAAHFHANDANRRGPGFGDTDFLPILRALRDSGYSGWISVEVFDFTPDPETIARESIRYLRTCAARLEKPT